MNKKNIFKMCAICAPFFFCAGVFARGNQELVESGNWIYSALGEISAEQKTANFSDSGPLSIAELRMYMSEIDYSALSEPSKALYDCVVSYFDETPLSVKAGEVTCGIEPFVNFSAFYKTEDDIPWVYDRYERKPLLFVPVSVSIGDFFTAKMDVYFSENKNSSLLNGNYTNIPVSADNIDINFPDNGYVSLGKMISPETGVSLKIGKGSKNIGRTSIGSVIWSDRMTGISYAEASVFSPNFRYSANVSQFNVDRYMYLHQLDARFFKKVTFTAIEGMFVNAPLELRYLNPFTIFHGMAPWRDYGSNESTTCAYLGLKFQYVPVSNMRIYGLYAMTQFQTHYEVTNWPDNTTPNGIGFQGGLEYFLPVKKGRLNFSLEGSSAQPYLYIKESPAWSLVHTFSESIGNAGYSFYEWIGSPFGPDTVGGELKIGWQIPNRFSLNLKYLFMAKGEMSENSVFKSVNWGGTVTKSPSDLNGWCYPESGDMDKAEAKRRQGLATPTGIPEYVNRISLSASYNWTKKIETVLQPSLVFVGNSGHQNGEKRFGFEIAAACSIKLF